VHRCIASTPLHYDSYIAIFIISAARRCPRSRLTSVVSSYSSPSLFPPPSSQRASARESASSFLANHRRLNSRPLATPLLRTSWRDRSMGGLTPLATFLRRRDEDARGLTRRPWRNARTCAFIVIAIGNSTARCNLRFRRRRLVICLRSSLTAFGSPAAIMRSRRCRTCTFSNVPQVSCASRSDGFKRGGGALAR